MMCNSSHFKPLTSGVFFFLSLCEACFELRGQSQHRKLQERNGSFSLQILSSMSKLDVVISP